MLSEGIVRIGTASSFNSEEHNDAIKDDELNINSWIYEPTSADLQKFSGLYEPRDAIGAGSAIRTRTAEDYHLFCLSTVLSADLFDDFDFDACLIIKDPNAFLDRLLVSVQIELRARGSAFDAVKYLDPLTQADDETPIAFQKHFKHLYQLEARAAWLPSERGANLDTHFVSIGPLHDIAEIFLPA